MLKHSDIQPTIPATDLDRARVWYADKLGLHPDQEVPGALRYRVGASGGFLLFSAGAAGTSEHQVAAWVVADLETEVAELRCRGVAFEEYNRPGIRTVDGIATTPAGKAAWFKDGEGNILTLTQLG